MTDHLTLAKADQLKINTSRKSDVESLFGQPNIKLPIPDKNREAWLYCEGAPCAQGRLTIQFDSESGLVKTVIWNLHSGDSYQELKSAIDHYKHAHFEKFKYLYDYGHFFDETVLWSDLQQGILLGYDEKKGRVSSISRIDPNESLAIDSNIGNLPRITVIPTRKAASAAP